MATDILAPIVIMAVVGSYFGRFEFGLSVGFGLGIWAFFKYWAKGEAAPVDFTGWFKRVRKDEEGESK